MSTGTAYTVPEAADLLRISERFARQLIASGDLPHRRVGRRVLVTEADIDAFLDDRREGGAA